MKRKMKDEPKLPKQLFIAQAKAIEAVLQRAVAHALSIHKQAGNSIAAWDGSKVIIIPAEEITIPTKTTLPKIDS